jgi:hypothetical protein
MAVGAWSTATSSRALSARWNGSKWRLVPTPGAAGLTAPRLLGVSCPRRGNCWAVGLHTGTTQIVTLIEHWNGTKWVLVQH